MAFLNMVTFQELNACRFYKLGFSIDVTWVQFLNCPQASYETQKNCHFIMNISEDQSYEDRLKIGEVLHATV